MVSNSPRSFLAHHGRVPISIPAAVFCKIAQRIILFAPSLKCCLFHFNIAEVDKGVGALNGRYFGGRIVRAERYDQDMFDNNDLSG